VSVTGGSQPNTFAYDGDGHRVSQTVTSGTYTYVNDLASSLPTVLQENGPDGFISYAYGLGLISESSSAFDYFYHVDGLGSTISLTDSTGSIQQGYTYDVWGNIGAPAPNYVGTANKFRYTGQALDPGTSLYFLRARYFDDTLGRLITRDPLNGVVLKPLTTNRFIYSLNQPLTLSDPTGMAAENGSAGGALSLTATDFLPTPGNANSTPPTGPPPTTSPTIVTKVVEGACKVVGAGEFLFEKTSDFLAGAAIHYVASNGGSRPVSNVPCYSQIPGIGLFFSSVPSAR
jgi:RHS repeat-associated protein